MTDPARYRISPADRALIDAHITRHGVTVCPPGTFSVGPETTGMTWINAATNHMRGKRLRNASQTAQEARQRPDLDPAATHAAEDPQSSPRSRV